MVQATRANQKKTKATAPTLMALVANIDVECDQDVLAHAIAVALNDGLRLANE
jgi:hypothetical protein